MSRASVSLILEAGHRSVTDASNRRGAPCVTVNSLFNSIFARVCLYVFSVSLRVTSLRNNRARPWIRRLVTGLSQRVQSQVIPCGICGGQSVGGKDFSLSISLSPCQHYSANISYSFVHLSPTPYISNWQRRQMTFLKKNLHSWPITLTRYRFLTLYSGFGSLEVACWPLVPKFAGSHPAEAVGFLGRKNPQHAFLRRRSKAVVALRHVKDP